VQYTKTTFLMVSRLFYAARPVGTIFSAPGVGGLGGAGGGRGGGGGHIYIIRSVGDEAEKALHC
jgi:hypothetical protein